MKVGDTVTWTSQAMGCEKTKTGVIIAEIPAGIMQSGISRQRRRKATSNLIQEKAHMTVYSLPFPPGKIISLYIITALLKKLS